MEEHRRSRLYDEYTEVIYPRLIDLDEAIREHYVQYPLTDAMDFRPHFIDFAFMPECRALADAPSSQQVSQADFAALIPNLGAQWMAAQERELKALLIKQLQLHHGGDSDDSRSSTPDGTSDPFRLALGVFFCTGPCGRALLRYPEVLAHGCTRKTNLAAVEKRHLADGDHYAHAAAILDKDDIEEWLGATWDKQWDGSYKPFDLTCFSD